MNDIRARFEEIWPVPEGVAWDFEYGRYMMLGEYSMKSAFISAEYNGRLDTFTRCQETTNVYVSLVEELINNLSECANKLEWLRDDRHYEEIANRAKQIMERKK